MERDFPGRAPAGPAFKAAARTGPVGMWGGKVWWLTCRRKGAGRGNRTCHSSAPALRHAPAPSQVTDRNVENLSGGELQRFAIAAVALQVRDEQKNVAEGVGDGGAGYREGYAIVALGLQMRDEQGRQHDNGVLSGGGLATKGLATGAEAFKEGSWRCALPSGAVAW